MAIKHILPAGLLTLAGLLGTPALAQNVDTVSFPLKVLPRALVDGTLEYQPRPGALVDLMGRQAVTMAQVELPSGQFVDLELIRVNADFASMGVQVNGQPSPFDPLDLTLWRGHASGLVDSDVFLSFSSHGCNGWIFVNGEYNHLMAFAAPGNDWSQANVRLVPETVLIGLGGSRANLCGIDGLVNASLTPAATNNGGVASPTSLGGTFNLGRAITLECKVSVETDYQYYQNWGNLQACQTYTATLLAEISDRYNSQLDVVLTYPYLQFYTSFNDPWNAQGGGAGAVLDQFRNAWAGNIPAGGNLAHFLSGVNLGGGIAHPDELCDSNWGFGVSGNMHGGTQFPVSQGSNTWDFVVMAHEVGHNFGTVHTHEYCPPLDQCASFIYFGQCQSTRNCINSGTIMSYCHTCSGGINNITTYFHPTVAATMRAEAENSCLQPYLGGGCSADSLEPNDTCGAATSVGAGSYTNLTACGTDSDYYQISVANNETVTFDLFFTHANGDVDCTLWDSICLTSLDSSTSRGDGESVTWTNISGSSASLRLDVILYGGSAGAGNDYSMDVTLVPSDPCVGLPDDSLEDNDSCGTATPMLDGTQTDLFVSKTDADFYELCVPGGGTLEVDALFSQAGGDIDTYLYSLGSCGGGTLNSLAQGNSNSDDENINWTNPDTVSTPVLIEVRMHVSSSSNCNVYDLVVSGAGANCSGPGSIGTIYCSPANLNSTIASAYIAATGSTDVADNDVALTVTQLPHNQLGYFLSSQDQTMIVVPGGSQGNLCVGGSSGLGRHLGTVQYSDSNGVMTAVLDLGQIPTQAGGTTPVISGQTYNFQCWFRDFYLVSTSNFSDAVSITFH
ncbi:MAG: hypothetical protein GY930_13445 [bacterium]|nr:hypothetical protein [bacterium]